MFGDRPPPVAATGTLTGYDHSNPPVDPPTLHDPVAATGVASHAPFEPEPPATAAIPATAERPADETLAEGCPVAATDG